MNPHQKNKIDLSKLNQDEQRMLRLYGKLPNRKDLLQNKLKERKYFDSGDYALSKAGKASDAGVTDVGSRHPQPENIPHVAASPPQGIPGVGNGVGGAAGGPHHPSVAIPSAPNGHENGGIVGSPVRRSGLQTETDINEPSEGQADKGQTEDWSVNPEQAQAETDLAGQPGTNQQ